MRKLLALAAVLAAFSFSAHAQLVRPGLLEDKPVLKLTAAFVVAELADGISTKHWERNPFDYESGPYGLLLGRRPAWNRMAPLGAAEVIGLSLLAHKMHQSRHGWARKTWWIPQTFAISWHAEATVHNYRSY